MKKYTFIGLLALLSHHAHAIEQSISKDLTATANPTASGCEMMIFILNYPAKNQ